MQAIGLYAETLMHDVDKPRVDVPLVAIPVNAVIYGALVFPFCVPAESTQIDFAWTQLANLPKAAC